MFEEFRNNNTSTMEPDEFDELIEQIKNEEIKLEKTEKVSKNIIEVGISLFTVINGKINTLLIKKKDEPYKGYWTLPSNLLKENENIDYNISHILNTELKTNNIYKEQVSTFTNIQSNYSDNTVFVSYIGFVDYYMFKFKHEKDSLLEYSWFSINDIPKMAYENNKIIMFNINKVIQMLSKLDIIKILFPNDFTLHELQSLYEQAFSKTFDRRNFRKKFLNFDLIEETGEYNEKTNGRPSKLYRFKEKTQKTGLF